jgi:hypothetical protein
MNRLNWFAGETEDHPQTTLTQDQLDKYIAISPSAGDRVEGVYRPDNHYGFQAKPNFKRVGWAEERAKDGQKKPIYEHVLGLCPCKVCNHTYEIECEIIGCNCCSEFCT